MKKEDCIFCKIVEEKIPATKINENKDFICFLDINPVSYGHSLIIPKEHIHLMTDASDEVLGKAFVYAKKMMKQIKKGMNADYVALSVVGVDVPHFHIHLIPRYFNDRLASFWPTKKYKGNEIEEIAESLRKEKIRL